MRAKAELLSESDIKSEPKPAHRPKEAWTDTDTAEKLGVGATAVDEAKTAERELLLTANKKRSSESEQWSKTTDRNPY